MIFMLYRDDYYNREIADDETGKSDIELNVVKNKDGETGVVELEFYKNTEVLLMIIAELQTLLGDLYRNDKMTQSFKKHFRTGLGSR